MSTLRDYQKEFYATKTLALLLGVLAVVIFLSLMLRVTYLKTYKESAPVSLQELKADIKNGALKIK